MHDTLTPLELDALNRAEKPLLLDVRRAADRANDPEGVPGAIWRDPEKLGEWISEVPPGEKAVIFCARGGSISTSVQAALREKGAKVRFVAGGLEGWKRADTIRSLIREDDVVMLRGAGMNAEDLAHSLRVAGRAADIAVRTGAPANGVDLELVARGALFHDLGKTVTHKIEHGRIGAELGATLGLPPEITAIMEKHIRGGLTEAEAVEFGLPVKDYGLHRLEERIVIYADRLTDIDEDESLGLTPLEAEARFEEILRTYPKYGKNEITMNRYLGYHREIQGLISQATKTAPKSAPTSA